MMDEQLQNLMVDHIKEVLEVTREISSRIERLEERVENMRENQKKDESSLSKTMNHIETRLGELEGFRTKLIVIASTVAFVMTVAWEILAQTFFRFGP